MQWLIYKFAASASQCAIKLLMSMSIIVDLGALMLILVCSCKS